MNNNLKIIGVVLFFIILLVSSLSFVSPALADDIVSYYKLDEAVGITGTIVDELSNYDGTNYGAINTTGKINYGYLFNDTDDYDIRLGDMDLLENFTINCWIKPSDVTQRQIITDKRQTASSNDNFANWNMELADACGSGKVEMGIPGVVACSTTTLNDNTWYMITGRYDNSTRNVTIFIDGTYEDDATAPVGPKFGDGGARIGGWMRNVGNYNFNGVIDGCGYWDELKTFAEITELYSAGTGLDYPFTVDTCSCPGAGNDWEIDMSDACEIVDDCDLTTGTLSFTGAGTTKINAIITTTNLGDPGASGILRILSNAIIWIKGI